MSGARGIEAGRAYVRIFSEDSDLVRGLRGIEAKFKTLGPKVSAVGAKVAAIGGGLAGLGASIVGPITLATKSFVEFGDSLNKMAARTGFSSEALSELGFAAEQSGAGIDDVEKSVQRMQRAITDAADGSKMIGETFAALGLSVETLQRLQPDQQFQAIAGAIAKLPDPTERAARAMQIFGRSGTKLLPLITSDIQGLRDEAKKLGITLSTDDANAAAELGDAMNRVGRTVKAAFIKLGAAVAPAITKGLGVIVEITQAVAHWVDKNRTLVTVIAAVGAGLTALGTLVASLGGGIALLGFGISGVGAAAGALAGIITGTMGPAIAITAGVAAGVVALGAGFAYVAHQAGLLAPAFEFLKQSFGRVYVVFQAAFGGIVKALQGGQFQLAAEIAWAGVKVATLKGAQQVLKGVDYLWNNAGQLSSRFFSKLIESTYNVFKELPRIAFQALQGGAALRDAIQRALAGAFTADLDLAARLDPAIGQAQQQFRQKLGQANRIGQGGPPPREIQNQALRPQGARANFAVPAPAAVAPVVNAAVARPVAAAGGGGAATPGMAELVGLNRQQVIVLRQILGEGLG